MGLDRGDGGIDLRIGTFARRIRCPGSKQISELVQLVGGVEKSHDGRLGLGLRAVARLQRCPQRRSGAADELGVWREGEVDAADEIEHAADLLGTWLRVPHQRRTQAPVSDSRAFGEVDQSSQLGWFGIGRHGRQRRSQDSHAVEDVGVGTDPLVAIERSDRSHLLVGQLEVEEREVLFDT